MQASIFKPVQPKENPGMLEKLQLTMDSLANAVPSSLARAARRSAAAAPAGETASLEAGR